MEQSALLTRLSIVSSFYFQFIFSVSVTLSTLRLRLRIEVISLHAGHGLQFGLWKTSFLERAHIKDPGVPCEMKMGPLNGPRSSPHLRDHILDMRTATGARSRCAASTSSGATSCGSCSPTTCPHSACRRSRPKRTRRLTLSPVWTSRDVAGLERCCASLGRQAAAGSRRVTKKPRRDRC